MDYSEAKAANAKAREKKKEYQLHHVEIYPERDASGKPVKGGGHTVHSIHREVGEEWGRERRAEKPFGAGEHEEMLAHVANELKLPEPKDSESEEDEDKSAAGAAY